jgi:hypothetical protein
LIIRPAFGEPQFGAEVRVVGIIAIAFSFYRYKSETTDVRFEYLADDVGLRMITIEKIVT